MSSRHSARRPRNPQRPVKVKGEREIVTCGLEILVLYTTCIRVVMGQYGQSSMPCSANLDVD